MVSTQQMPEWAEQLFDRNGGDCLRCMFLDGAFSAPISINIYFLIRNGASLGVLCSAAAPIVAVPFGIRWQGHGVECVFLFVLKTLKTIN
jgi:hypothetical protein